MTQESQILTERLRSVLLSEKNNDAQVYFFFSPGRINLIGEHVDYKGTGGKVMPAAINLGITAAAAKCDRILVNSLNYPEKGWQRFASDHIPAYDPDRGFMNFVFGAYRVLSDLNASIGGIALVLDSSLPSAAGLSSSAAVSILVLRVLNDLYLLNLSPVEIALRAQRIENEYIGLKSGIMDQFAIANGKRDNFMLLDTLTLDYKFVPLRNGAYKFFIINTSKSRVLSASAYNDRVNELNEVKRIFSACGLAFKNLAEASEDKYLDIISNNTLRRRFKHVLTEIRRAEKVGKKLATMSGVALGKVLNASHASLRDDYEVSCEEADFIHFKLLSHPLVFGARIIGAGFGGCVLVVANKEMSVNDFDFGDDYFDKFKLKMEVYEFEVTNGTRRI